MKSRLQPEVRDEVRRRLASIPVRMSLGDLPVREKRIFLRYPPFKQLVLYVFPFPRGAPTARELIDRTPGDIDAERRDSVLGYKHSDHHLRQFGA